MLSLHPPFLPRPLLVFCLFSHSRLICFPHLYTCAYLFRLHATPFFIVAFKPLYLCNTVCVFNPSWLLWECKESCIKPRSECMKMILTEAPRSTISFQGWLCLSLLVYSRETIQINTIHLPYSLVSQWGESIHWFQYLWRLWPAVTMSIFSCFMVHYFMMNHSITGQTISKISLLAKGELMPHQSGE